MRPKHLSILVFWLKLKYKTNANCHTIWPCICPPTHSTSLSLSLTHRVPSRFVCLPALPFPYHVWRSLAFSACIYGRKILRHKADSTTKCDKFATPTEKNKEEKRRRRKEGKKNTKGEPGAGRRMLAEWRVWRWRKFMQPYHYHPSPPHPVATRIARAI